jgi:hypothetical protein
MENIKRFCFISFCVFSFISLITPLLLGSLAIFLIGLLLKDKLLKESGFNMMLSIDQFGNAILLGDPDETISSRTGRAILSGRPKLIAKMMHKFVDKLFHVLIGEKNHCIKAVEECRKFDRELWDWISPE